MEKSTNEEEMARAVGELLEVCRNCKLYPAMLPIIGRMLTTLQGLLEQECRRMSI